ncbi:glycosyltransferase [Candidatus Hakubella thermalkaliphila]|nr:glycosyltransferase [Candidatus Hakubella thermalkaliphila]
MVVIEAMASAKPVIVSDTSGVAEVIKDGVNGFRVCSRNPKQIANKIRMLIQDSQLRKRVGEKGRDFVHSNLSWERFATDCEEAFQKVLRKNSVKQVISKKIGSE